EAEVGLRVLGRGAEAAGEGELQAASQAGAMDRRDGGERQLREAEEEVVAAFQEVQDLCLRPGALELLDVRPGDEAVGLARENDEPLRALPLDLGDPPLEPCEEAGTRAN